ncbi:DNA polymerase [Corynebacterium meridianum]|uniref:DNA-directed DNA polymerase n=1 Tax=Corynebacterium meridianum TaxID=2765363 RepID=A0A934M6G3_9CORY|nr:DNA polymerase [Corynebacterium meridianum]MBI8988432.1 DNA polymerase I [Corynebacterium meridianum]
MSAQDTHDVAHKVLKENDPANDVSAAVSTREAGLEQEVEKTLEDQLLGRLSPQHLQELRDASLSDEYILKMACRTVRRCVDALPSSLEYLEGNATWDTGLLYDLELCDGVQTAIIKVPPGFETSSGDTEAKYISPGKFHDPDKVVSFAWRRKINEDTERVLLVEGVKQSAAAEEHLKDEKTAVVFFNGVNAADIGGKGGDSEPFKALYRSIKGLDVVIAPDADAGTNARVYDGVRGLGELCESSAKSVKYLVLPNFPGAAKSAGLDDYLAFQEPRDRAEAMSVLLEKHVLGKPAKKKPRYKKEAPSEEELAKKAGTRKVVSAPVSDGMLRYRGLLDVYEKTLFGVTLFSQDGVLYEAVKRGGTVSLSLVSRTRAHALAKDSVLFVDTESEKAKTYTPSMSDSDSALDGAGRSAPEIKGVVHTPLIREDFSFRTEPGFDEASGVFVHLDSSLEGLTVKENVSKERVDECRELILDALADFPFKSGLDRARAVGMVLTLLLRPLLPTSPGQVAFAALPGTGKNLLVNVACIIATGEPCPVLPRVKNNDELQKDLYARVAAKDAAVCFDEVERLDSPPLRAVLTTPKLTGRILGSSETPTVENRLSLFFTGNNIDISNDMGRRVSTVHLALEDATVAPEERGGFKHPELLEYVKKNRKELLQAFYDVIVAWVEADQPACPTYEKAPMGSFERWHRVVGGILYFLGLGDIREDYRALKESLDFDGAANEEYLCWLFEVFGDENFSAAQVVSEVAKDGTAFVPSPRTLPEGVRSISEAKPTEVGTAHRQLLGKPYGGLVLRRRPKSHRNKAAWRYFIEDLDGSGGDGGGGGRGGEAPVPTPPSPTGAGVSATSDESTTVVFDLETGSAEDAVIATDRSFVKIAAYSVNGAEPVVTDDIEALVEVLRGADRVVGQNVVQYDLPLLKRLYDLELDPGVAHDTLILARIVDPPVSGSGKTKSYALDAVAERLGHDGKLLDDGVSALKNLANQYGGFDAIPNDNETYRKYAAQDVKATAELYADLLPQALEAVGEDVIAEEHELAAVLALTEFAGVRVDVDAVEEFLAREAAVKADAYPWLVEHVGVPDEGKKPHTSRAGKAALSEYLEKAGITPPVNAKGNFCFDKDTRRQLVRQHPDNEALLALVKRLDAVSDAETPASTVKAALREDGRVYPSIRVAQATGRLSTRTPAMTVFGSRGDLVEQRTMILPDEGEVLLSADLSQIDQRCLAAGAGDENYAAMFQPGRDSHTELAIRVFDDECRRQDAKALGHAVNYGKGARKFAEDSGLSLEEAEKLLRGFKAEFTQLELLKEKLRNQAKKTGFISTAFGRRVAVNPERAYTAAPAAYGQGTARDVFVKGILALPKDVQQMIRIYVHDEVVLSVPKDRVDEVREAVLSAFCGVELPSVEGARIPVLAEAGDPGKNWAEAGH